jgi:hypothetical protein
MKTIKRNINNGKKNTKKNKRKIYFLKGGGEEPTEKDPYLDPPFDDINKNVIQPTKKFIFDSLFSFGNFVSSFNPTIIIVKKVTGFVEAHKETLQNFVQQVKDVSKNPRLGLGIPTSSSMPPVPPAARGGSKRRQKKTK